MKLIRKDEAKDVEDVKIQLLISEEDPQNKWVVMILSGGDKKEHKFRFDYRSWLLFTKASIEVVDQASTIGV